MAVDMNDDILVLGSPLIYHLSVDALGNITNALQTVCAWLRFVRRFGRSHISMHCHVWPVAQLHVVCWFPLGSG
jgi:hypothetical protein